MPGASTSSSQIINLGVTERWAAIAGGLGLISYGVKKGSAVGGAALAILGADCIYTGIIGYSPFCNALGLRLSKKMREASATIPYQQGIRVDTAVTILTPREELFSFWRNLENLPRFMRHLHSVTRIDDTRSHWIAEGPGGKMLEWDAEIINEEQNERIGWRSLPGSDLDTAGSVHFKTAPGGRGTEVHVELQYIPPAGALGAAYAKLMRQDPADRIKDDLRRLKQILETGETATVEGQSHGKEVFPRRERVRPRRASHANSDQVNAASEESFPASDAPSWTAHREELVS
jgi:uncharacterized membrane protein